MFRLQWVESFNFFIIEIIKETFNIIILNFLSYLCYWGEKPNLLRKTYLFLKRKPLLICREKFGTKLPMVDTSQ